MPTFHDKCINTLIAFYLDPKCMSVYHGRWDTWMVTKNNMDEYFYLMLKTDDQLKRMTDYAKAEAEKVRNSPLTKALNEQ